MAASHTVRAAAKMLVGGARNMGMGGGQNIAEKEQDREGCPEGARISSHSVSNLLVLI